MTATLAAFVLYLIGVLSVGFFAARFSSRGLSHYFLADRSLGSIVVGLSAVASGRSAWLLLGFSGMAFKMGLSAIWATAGYILVEASLFLTVGRRLREATGNKGDITLPDYFASRFPERATWLRLFTAIPIIFFLTAYVSAQLLAAGKAFNSSFDLPISEGILLASVIILVYTLLGGFMAVAITDVIQGIFMILALILLPLVVLFQQGGFGWMIDSLAGQDPLLLSPWNLTAGILIGFLGIGLGSVGNPHILVRFMSVKREGDLIHAALIGTAANIFMAAGATLTGLVGRALYRDLSQLPASDAENILPHLAREALHPFVFGLVLAAVFAAIMSTCDSQLLVASSGLVRDIYQKIVRRDTTFSEKELVLLSRVMVFLLIVLALLLGVIARDLVFWFVLFSWSGLGATIGPALLFALYDRRVTPGALMSGMVIGTITTLIWGQVPMLKGIIYELVPAFLLSALVIFVVSRMNVAESREKENIDR